jgi:hypothetical protein
MANSGTFKKGDGRKRKPKGAVTKVTTTVKEAILKVYDNIGGDQGFADWANEEKTEFYKIYARLVPLDVQASGEITITVNKMVDK